jgi:putative endonuclease
MRQYFVYILKCADGSYYTGITNDVDRRFEEHQSGYNPKAYTFRRRPLELVFYLDFPDPVQAIDFEKQVKGWTRKKKEAIIRGDWESLKELAACKNKTSHLGFDSAQPDSGFDTQSSENDGHPERSRREPESKGAGVEGSWSRREPESMIKRQEN